MGVHLVAGLVDMLEGRAGELELAAGLQGDRGAILLERDEFAFLLQPGPAELLGQAFENGLDRALA